ncbi:acyl-CoA dehydrogenase family protein [Zhihengliuella salsuginis]|uniref:Acyl-CoA dehydrogenase n=1 Tax=Zhihengliuella salsuginis TaxID=578222 RepID=A0ABQ3GCY0_9MICC|nr:acyl-CoA dehydrogenase [Zhihengliuella salsuginis]GHD01680.1 acyl-CoA dehydrogenase [Zhihengliuella salsuginis]
MSQDVPESTTEDPRVDVAALGEQLLGRWADVRRTSRALAAEPRTQKIEGQSMDEHRERVLDQLGYLVEQKAVHRAFPERLGGQENPGGNIAGFEELVVADPSLQIKAGVQWGLFGSAVLHLGTREHQDQWLPGIMNMDIPGAFAMTEIGHGSDVASIATTATYDPAAEEFVLHTPFRAAWKEFLGNAGLHGKAAVVFAQLITAGVNHGVHAFYVPIRDEDGFLPGIGGEDDGLKGGLNGIDNGRLHFDHVRFPRTNLLNRYGDVAPDGTYSSPIESPGRRFFTMLGTLVQGRVSLDGAATAASKVALQIAVGYANERRQFNASSDTAEEVLLDYQRHQRRLLPRVAATYAMSFAHEELLEKFHEVFSKDATDDERQDLETLAAALKPLSTWNALDIVQECREACGGAGFITKNRFTSLRADLDVYVTFEGDNNVLLQLVAKRLLADYAQEFRKLDAGALTRYVVRRAEGVALNQSGLRQLAQTWTDAGSEKRSANFLKDPDTQRDLLAERVRTMVAEVAEDLKGAAKLPQAQAAAVFNERQEQIISAARAHAELLQWEAFTRQVEKIEDPGTRSVVTWLRDLFGLCLIEADLGWFQMSGLLSGQRARTLGPYINRLLARLRPHAQDLVDSFGYTQAHLRADIVSGIEAERQDEAMEYFRTLRASKDAPIDEKIVLARKRAAGKAAKRAGAR